jgi:ATP-dependent RNA helicase RhlE
MGFIRDIKKILAMLPKQRQNLLFSATFSDEIKALADGLLHNPGFVEVARRNTASELVEQTVHMVAQGHKRELMSHLIQQNDWQQVLIFTRTKHGANRLAEKLVKDGIQSAAIHGNKSQSARTKALAQFKDGSMRVLVATDIAARGLDIDQLPQVVNFELPNVPEDYVHRIGRTGRAGSSGAAVSLVDREELKLLKDIEKLIKREIPKVQVEGFTPSDKPEPEAPRSTQAHGRPPRGHGQGQQRKAHVPTNTEGNGTSPNAGRNQNRSNGQHNGQAPRNDARANTEGRSAQGNKARPAQSENTKNMSEAARHQAMPQPALFVPPSPSRHQPNRQNATRSNEGRGNAGRTNTNPNSTHRSGGRGR